MAPVLSVPFMASPLMIIDDLDVFRAIIDPIKANAPLPVDADAVLTRAIALQQFQSVAWRLAQILNLHCRIEQQQLDPRSLDDIRRELPRRLIVKHALGVAAAEGADHVFILPGDGSIVNRRTAGCS